MTTAQRHISKIVVASIDFGTTYSGYAYAFRDEFVKDPLKIYSNSQWIDEETGFASFKAPTSILFDQDGKFHSFGFPAENKYAELLDNEEDDDWKFFKRFKMKLYEETDTPQQQEQVCARKKRLKGDFHLKDAHNQRFSAKKVFFSAIKFLKDHLMQTIQGAKKDLTIDDVFWVLTVPAIWSDPAKQFMREAANEAGITNDQLTLALEPEAAAIYCKEISVRKAKDGGESDTDLSAFEPGERFILLDCGGGTVDVTCEEVQNDGTLKEVYPPSGGDWGGTKVDHAYLDWLKRLVGNEVWSEFDNKADKLELERTFEVKKRNIGKDGGTNIKLCSSLQEKFKEKHKQTLSKSIGPGSPFHGKVEVKKDKIRIPNFEFETFFDTPIKCIIEHVKKLQRLEKLSGVSTLLMVGGFAECQLMANVVKAAFSEMNVIIPLESSLAVLKGAVIFGHSPSAICERACPRTYGISVSVPWNEKVHKSCHKFCSPDGNPKCSDVFQVMVRRGESIVMGKSVSQHMCRPANARDTEAVVEIYESLLEEPKYTTYPESRKLGEMVVRIPDTMKGKDRYILVKMHFGFTELKVTAQEEGTNNFALARFNCLN